MHVDEVGRRLDEIRDILAEVRRLNIPYSAVSKNAQEQIQARIENLFDRYYAAVENNVVYLNGIRKEINRVKHDLQQLIKFDDSHERRVKLRVYRWYMFYENK